MPELQNHQHELFCQKYCALNKVSGSGNKPRFNASRAAMESGYSKKTAGVQGHELLKNPKIKARIEELVGAEIENTIIGSERIKQELSYLSTSDVTEAFDSNGNPLPIHQIPERLRRCISGFELVEERDENGEPTGHMVKKFKFYDKNASLNTLAKVHKMLTDKVEHEHKVTLENFLGGTWPDDNDQKGKSPKDKKK